MMTSIANYFSLSSKKNKKHRMKYRNNIAKHSSSEWGMSEATCQSITVTSSTSSYQHLDQQIT